MNSEVKDDLMALFRLTQYMVEESKRLNIEVAQGLFNSALTELQRSLDRDASNVRPMNAQGRRGGGER